MSNVQKVLNKCFTCRKFNSQPKPQIMGPLPTERLQINKPPFSATGVDYFGPIIIQRGKYRRQNSVQIKRYGAVFNCLITRAVHLEVADLSTKCFILALRRFIACHGHPNVLYSDNGLNFVGVNKELHKLISSFNKNKINNFLKDNTEWKFIPSNSPWMGACWESIVKIVKRALKTVTKDRPVTEECLNTFLNKVESTVNNRPLLELTDNIEDLSVLTPNHFLIGSQSSYNFSNIKEENEFNFKSKWKSVNALHSMFWKRFIQEYIPTLNIRRKWSTHQRNVKVNDIVLLKSENLKRSFGH